MIFIVCYAQGASGSFLSVLLERIYYGNTRSFNTYSTDQNNCAHGSHQYHNYKELIPGKPVSNPPDRFTLLQLLDPDAPAFLPVHSFDPALYRSKFPSSKIITIVHEESDALELSINILYKHLLSETRYRNRKDLNGKILPDYRWANRPIPQLVEDIRNTDVINFTNEQLRKIALIGKVDALNPGFHLLGEDPSVYGKDIWFIKYRDIIDNPEHVIAVLEEVTGQTAGESAWEAMNYYRQRQQEFMSRVKKDLNL